MSCFNLRVIGISSSSSCSSINAPLGLFVPFVHCFAPPSHLSITASPTISPRMSMVSILDANDLRSLPLNQVNHPPQQSTTPHNKHFGTKASPDSNCSSLPPFLSGGFQNPHPPPSPPANWPTFSHQLLVFWCESSLCESSHTPYISTPPPIPLPHLEGSCPWSCLRSWRWPPWAGCRALRRVAAGFWLPVLFEERRVS
jgi:hypothetical protein